MTSVLDKIADNLPISDGGIRRRFISGGIIVLAVLFTYLPDNALQQILTTDTASLILTSPVLAIVFALIIYAVGGVAELIGSLFIARAFGEVFHIVSLPYRKHRKRGLLMIIIYYIIWFIPGMYVLYFAFFRGLVGITNYNIPIDRQLLSKEAIHHYKRLPYKVKRGLSIPLGNDFEYAWGFICDHLTQVHQVRANKAITETKEILTIITSLMICIFLYFIKMQIYSYDVGSHEVINEVETGVSVQQAIGRFYTISVIFYLSVFFLFRGYFLKVRSVIYLNIELYAINQNRTSE